MVSLHILISDLEIRGFEKWISSWLYDCSLRVVVSSSVSRWRLTISGYIKESLRVPSWDCCF